MIKINLKSLGVQKLQELVKKSNKCKQSWKKSSHIIEGKYEVSLENLTLLKEIYDSKIKI